MARGWESKSVEEQQSEFQRPDTTKASQSAEQVRKANRLQALQLQRANVQAQLKQSENPRYIELLQRELEHLDQELRNLRTA